MPPCRALTRRAIYVPAAWWEAQMSSAALGGSIPSGYATFEDVGRRIEA
ncbi:hypothetical protein [Allohahella sp. A8]